MEQKNNFKELQDINVNDKVEKKNGLTYLSWAWAWQQVKLRHPNATYKVYENTLPNGYAVNYFTDGSTSYVKVGVVIDELEHIEMLPVMDYRNKSIKLENMTSFDVNTAIQRCLTKAIARHGLGLYIYAGEDLPSDSDEEKKPESPMKGQTPKTVATPKVYSKDEATIQDNDALEINKYLSNQNDMGKVKFNEYLKKNFGVDNILLLSEDAGRRIVNLITSRKGQ